MQTVKPLDGGRRKGEAENRALSTRPAGPTPTRYSVGAVNSEPRAHLTDVVAVAEGKSDAALVDIRSPDEYQQLQSPRIHRVLSSDEVLGGPHGFTLIRSKERFRTENTKTYADVMRKAGAIKNRPASWKDVVFEDLHGETGNRPDRHIPRHPAARS